MRFLSVQNAMREHDREHAPGSESAQWQAFVADCGNMGLDLFNGVDDEIDVEYQWAWYWKAVACHDWDDAEKYGHVPPEWRE